MPFGLARMTLALGLVATPASGATEGAERLEESRARLVRLPILLDERQPGGCDGLAHGDILLEEDGVRVSTTHLESRPPGSVHAVLIDTGFDMLEAIADVRAAVAAYVRQLPPDEPALLATFDDDLMLHAPLTTDREGLLEALNWIDIGRNSRLWRGAGQMLRYLESRPERKVLVLLTRGCDATGNASTAAQAVVEAAERVDALSVFPVRIEARHDCASAVDGEAAGKLLEELARRTGGAFLERRAKDDLRSVVATVRDRVARERYLTYKPLELGQGPRDGRSPEDFRWRKRKIGLAGKRPCRITIAGPQLRYESLARRYPPASARRPGDTLLRPFVLDEPGRLAVGHVREARKGSVPVGGSPPRGPSPRADREVHVVATPVDRVVRETTGPEQALVLALAATVPPSGPQGPGAPWWDTPVWVQGATWLETRASIAVALAERPDYMRWARDHVRQRRLEEIDALLDQTDGENAVETLQRARRWFEGDTWKPEPLELQGQLAGWIGDVPLAELSNRFERHLADVLLAAASEPDRLAAATADARQSWERFLKWFPQPPAVRVVGLQVPAYDVDRDAIGFYRILLRSQLSMEINAALTADAQDRMVTASAGAESETLLAHLRAGNFSEDDPLGVRLVRWMLGRPGIAPYLQDRFHVRDVRYAHPTPRDLFPTLREIGVAARLDLTEGPYLARQVTLRLDSTHESGAAVAVSAYFRRERAENWGYSPEPVCLVLPAQLPTRGSGFALLGALVNSHRQGEVPCLLQERGAG